MVQEKLPAIVARIDERTAHIQEDVKEVKETAIELKKVVIKHGEDLATIKERIGNSNCDSNHHSLSKKQKAGIGGAVAAIISAIITFLTHYFSRH
ncbi:MAG: hypothetical protein ABSF21_00900 [Dehalococcoidia bacterium]